MSIKAHMPIAFCILSTVFGQLAFKVGMSDFQGTSGVDLLFHFFNPYILMGILFAVFATVSWLVTLKNFDLSYAFPFQSLTFVLVALLSFIFFDETLSYSRVGGLLLICVGIGLMTQKAPLIVTFDGNKKELL